MKKKQKKKKTKKELVGYYINNGKITKLYKED